MKVLFQREPLLESFKAAARVAPARSPKEILKSVYLHAGIDGVSLVSQNEGCAVRLKIDGCATIDHAGDALLSAQRFSAILSDCKSDKITVTLDGRSLLIQSDRSKFKLPTENPDDYPQPNFNASEFRCVVPATALASAIGRTVFACDEESSRFALGGVLFDFDFEAGKLHLVATDGRRMSVQELPATITGKIDSMTIVPAASLKTIMAMCKDEKGNVEFWTDGSSFCAETSRGVISARLMEGRFPKWRDVLPKSDHSTSIRLSVEGIVSCVKQASVTCDDETSRGIEWSAGDGLLKFFSGGVHGNSEVESIIEASVGQCGVNLDFRYTLDYLASLGDVEFVTVKIINRDRGVTFTTDDGHSYVLMPLGKDK
jgi:DNA polymerase-3 subunit beta